MNPIFSLTHNCLELTKRFIESVRSQDISVDIMVIDNGSKDGTLEWLDAQNDIDVIAWPENKGVSIGWNVGIHTIFAENKEAQCVLVAGNDTVLSPWTYRYLLSYDLPFVTGVAVDSVPTELPQRVPLNPHPDFSLFLIRRECWEKVGQFDERMKLYCSDCDYHIRAHRMGVPMWKANVPYYHISSQTLKRSTPEERAVIEAQANADREVFRSLYGCLPGTAEYYALFEEAHA